MNNITWLPRFRRLRPVLVPPLYSDSISYLSKFGFEVSNGSHQNCLISQLFPVFYHSEIFALWNIPISWGFCIYAIHHSPLLFVSWKNLKKMVSLHCWSPVCMPILNLLCVFFCPVLWACIFLISLHLSMFWNLWSFWLLYSACLLARPWELRHSERSSICDPSDRNESHVGKLHFLGK